MAIWMLTQMKRWGYIKGDVNYSQIAEQVFLATDAASDEGTGFEPGRPTTAKNTIMGKVFDPAPRAYARALRSGGPEMLANLNLRAAIVSITFLIVPWGCGRWPRPHSASSGAPRTPRNTST
jgi:hypothetical protein